MEFSEKDLEDWLADNPETLYPEMTIIGRQVRVASGIIDLVGFCAHPNLGVQRFSVIEVKRDKICSKALAQVSRYAHDLEQVTSFDHRFRCIHKVCVGTEWPSKQVLHEAEALDVEINVARHSFDLRYCRFSSGEKQEFATKNQNALNLLIDSAVEFGQTSRFIGPMKQEVNNGQNTT